jgi:predicted metalloprotease with PDZ domain
MQKLFIGFVLGCTLLASAAHAQMTLRVDARDIERSLIYAAASIPVTPGEDIDLFYVEWVPGNHNPSGPVWNIVDFVVHDNAGNALRWDRDPAHVSRITVHTQPDSTSITASYSYIANQPWVNSESTDSYGRPGYGGLNWNSVTWYPGNANKNSLTVEPHLTLPQGWQLATALPIAQQNENTTTFQTVSLARLVDSPVIFGKPDQLRTVTLDDGDPTTTHLFQGVAIEAENLELPEARIKKLNELLKQIHKVFGPYPHDEFHFLALLGDFPGLGLEHNTCTYFDMDADEWTSSDDPDGSTMGVVPHEYIHVWCGKLRAPVGLLNDNYHTPIDTEFLWVYEGLTSYYDGVVSVRAGLLTREQYTQSVQSTLYRYATQSGRLWRSVQDTARGMRDLRTPRSKWVEKIRRQDYYSEGSLFWMFADATIRRGTNNKKSLDDFCRAFFDVPFISFGQPVEYTRADIVSQLEKIYPSPDWDALILKYIEQPNSTITDDLPPLLGYTMSQTTSPSDALVKQETRRESQHRTLLTNTLGLYTNEEGKITTLLAGTPADIAGLAYNMKILAVNGESFSRDTLANAVETSSETGSLELLVEYYSKVWPIVLDYNKGASYPTLTRILASPDTLHTIMEPLPTDQE